MIWNGTKTWGPGEKARSTDLNDHVSDNLDYLFERPLGVVTLNQSGNYVSTSTAWVDVHGAELAVTLTLAGTRARVHFQGNFHGETSSPGTCYIFLDVSVDNVRQAGDDGIISGQAGDFPAAFTWVIEGLTPGSHTFRLMWKALASVGTPTATLYAGAGSSTKDLHPQFSVEEF